MGEISIEGLGIVEIEGDMPNEAEENAILSAIGDPDDDGITPQEEPVDSDGQLPEEQLPDEPPLGLLPEKVRESVRGSVEEQPGLIQLLAEIGPSIGGAIGGAAVGAPLGPVGVLGGAIVGGFAGEVVAQETGLAPGSDLNLILSAAGPVAGKAAGLALRGGRKFTGKSITSLPFARSARARNQMPGAVEEFESIGTQVLAKQRRLLGFTATQLYDGVRRSGVIVPNKALKGTRNAIGALLEEMNATKAFPEVSQAMKVLRQAGKTLGASKEISMDTLVFTRQLMGTAVKKAQSAGGPKLGTAKKAFAAISDDLDAIANDPTLTGRAARLAKAAVTRAKLEFAVKDFEAGVARQVKDVANGVEINIPGMQKWLRNITNPKSKQFDKNFTAALKDELPVIEQRLTELAKIVSAGSPGGPGSLVIRGQMAKAGSSIIGGLLGFGAGGVIGAGVGAFAGANAPEMFTALLMTKTGASLLERAARLGRGQISERAWIAAGQIALRSLGGDGAQAPSGATEAP